MRAARLLLVAGVVVLGLSLGLFVWRSISRLRSSTYHTFAAGQLSMGSGVSLPGVWTMKVTAPTWIPLGESGSVNITLTPRSTAAETVASEALAPYYVLAEARAEIPGAVTSPSGLSSETLTPGGRAAFEWRVQPGAEGTVDGRIWLYLRFVPKTGAPGVERPISLQPVIIQSVRLLGLSAMQAQTAALTAFSVGMIAAAPYLILRLSRRKTRDL
jgi:hypothetical protein